MNPEKIKILIINARKDQLARTASELNKGGYSVLISDGKSIGYKIAREKMPAVVLQFISAASDLPTPLNVSELSEAACSLVVVDLQNVLNPQDYVGKGFQLWQGVSLADNISTRLNEYLLSSDVLNVRSVFADYKVLVIDDELMNQTYYQEVLVTMGLQCDTCGDLTKAESKLKSTQYHLVITDVFLGTTIGLVISKVLKDLKQACKLIVVTGLGQTDFKEQFGDYECDAILHKPLNPLQLRNVVRNVLLDTHTHLSGLEKAAEEINNRYNPERAFRLLKNNEASIREVMKNFEEYLQSSYSALAEVKSPEQIHLLRKPFHDLGNLCYYFGAELLFELLGKYSTTQNPEKKFSMLGALEQELKLVLELHSQQLKSY